MSTSRGLVDRLRLAKFGLEEQLGGLRAKRWKSLARHARRQHGFVVPPAIPRTIPTRRTRKTKIRTRTKITRETKTNEQKGDCTISYIYNRFKLYMHIIIKQNIFLFVVVMKKI